ncbi:hypothetical protein HUN58_06290 [Curtobacterium sp. Csp1]|uniref:hypothetical protein n=1 Tax=unclassified Curtobacterium TaxID=257496 RepID=UPI001599CDB1|nr:MULTISPECIES: hypothetical protein [unclassified Curtobacterium]QKS11889.1 hypothetical protein HUN60_01040 [Curtobacterium sp. csp3]QKS19583.1 hypothetical protein HUN58_06290 [Curtobacterium sp. Csp1]
MVSRRDAAVRLDIPLEMASRHGLPAHLSEAELSAIESDPPVWLVQSRANRTGARKVWTDLTCSICGDTETARPKKWWPEWTLLVCDRHDPEDAPAPAPGHARYAVHGVGTRFVALVDEPA